MGLAEIGTQLLMATMHRRSSYGSWTTEGVTLGSSWRGYAAFIIFILTIIFLALFRGVLTLALPLSM